MSEHLTSKLRSVDARDFESRVGLALKRAVGAMQLTEHDPMVLMTALNDGLLLFLLTELPMADEKELRRQAFRYFRRRMDATLEKRRIAHSLMDGSNEP
jgi:hypothetical protein